jgi:hypothetical protein
LSLKIAAEPLNGARDRMEHALMRVRQEQGAFARRMIHRALGNGASAQRRGHFRGH